METAGRQSEVEELNRYVAQSHIAFFFGFNQKHSVRIVKNAHSLLS